MWVFWSKETEWIKRKLEKTEVLKKELGFRVNLAMV